MRVPKFFSSCLLSAAVLAAPISSFAGTPQHFASTPGVTVNVGEGAENYEIDFSYSSGQSSPGHVSGVEDKITGLEINYANEFFKDLSGANFTITNFVIYSKEGMLPNCDILNYNLSGKNPIVVNVNKSGCSVN
jgi:hypothetical protein